MILFKLLKSIRFWTILGTLTAFISLYFTYIDTAGKKSLTYTVVNVTPQHFKNHSKVGVICLIMTGSPPQEKNHASAYMMPSPISIGNNTGKTVNDIAEKVTTSTSPNFIKNHPSMIYLNEDGTSSNIYNQSQPLEILFEKINPKTATSSIEKTKGFYYYITINKDRNDFDRIIRSHYTVVYDEMAEPLETDVTMIVEIIETEFDKEIIPKLVDKYGNDFDEMYTVFYGPNNLMRKGEKINYYGLKIIPNKVSQIK